VVRDHVDAQVLQIKNLCKRVREGALHQNRAGGASEADGTATSSAKRTLWNLFASTPRERTSVPSTSKLTNTWLKLPAIWRVQAGAAFVLVRYAQTLAFLEGGDVCGREPPSFVLRSF
jgi:hypothetical protein